MGRVGEAEVDDGQGEEAVEEVVEEVEEEQVGEKRKSMVRKAESK